MLPTALFLFGLIAVAVSGMVAIFALRGAPDGFQDVNGFHLVTSAAKHNAFSEDRHEDSNSSRDHA